MAKPTRRRDPEKTRESIDSAALDLFAEKGFAGTATSEIAKRAGVAEGTIFRHYPNKKALLIGVMRPVIERVMAPLATKTVRKILTDDHDSVESLLRALLIDRIAMVDRVPPFLRVLLQEGSLHAEVRDLVASVFGKQVYPAFSSQLDDLKARGLVDPTIDNDSAIRMIVSVVGGYVLFAHVLYDDRDRFDDEREIEQMVRVLARGLAPSP
jgi:AcrR family transcriptional regulator